MGWSATAGEVDNFIYEDANSVFIADEDMRKRYSLYLLYFTCLTGTKVQVLTPEELQAAGDERVQLLYLLYWYKSTNTDAREAAGCWRRTRTRSAT